MTVFRQVQGRHGQFAVLAGDATVAPAITISGGFAEGAVRLLAGLLREGDTVVEIGAGIGAMAVPLARRIGPAGRLIAFEKQRLRFLCLATNAVLNGLDAMEPRQAASGVSPGSLALDSLGLDRLALLRIAVRGGGWAGLAGAAETIGRCRPVLHLRAAGDLGLRVAALRGLYSVGYRFWWHFAHFIPDDSLPPGIANPLPAMGDAYLLGLPVEHWARPKLPPVSAPGADWRADIDAFRSRQG
jgi:hypothetical protein